jgi:predicted GNAT family acetyltransferase
VNDAAAERALDTAVWSCLTTRHVHLALGRGRARRYPADISPIATVADATPDSVAALEALCAVGDDVAMAEVAMPVLGANWETLHSARITQMVWRAPAPLPEDAGDVAVLGAADVPDMLELVELTHPGPFRTRTIELGRFIGIREGGRLLAMAGERMWIGDHREVSGVCTHPDAQGRGFARALMARVVNRMLRAGQVPFLHAESGNARAIALYRQLGFVARSEVALLAARRVA